jgi:hypothetical protein
MMQREKWKPGAAGLVYLPKGGSLPGEKNREYFIWEVDGKLQWELRLSRMRWEEAFFRVKQLAEQENKTAFPCPSGENYKNLRDQGFLPD